MARRNSSRGGSSGSRRRSNNKSKEEARIERLTWMAMAGFLILLSFIDPENNLPDYIVPLVIAGILLASGSYQVFEQRNWKVSPFTWGIAFILGFFGVYRVLTIYNDWVPLPIDLRLITLVGVIFLILLGVLTNEM